MVIGQAKGLWRLELVTWDRLTGRAVGSVGGGLSTLGCVCVCVIACVDDEKEEKDDAALW